MAYPAEAVDLFYMSLYGGFGYDVSTACSSYLGLATGKVQGGNPPYTVSDFLSMYPWFFGPAASLAGTVTSGSVIISDVGSTTSVQAGQLVDGQFPSGTVVVSTTSDSITVSAAAIADASGVTIYTNPPISMAVIQAYLNLAYASLMWARWREMWVIAMGWYIAHFLTIYARSAASPSSSLAQIALAGLEKGILVSKSANDVSGSYQNLLTEFASWGSWAETEYGMQLISQAQVVGAGMIYVR